MALFKPLSIPKVLEHGHLPSLDGFRAISIILVVVEHTWHDAMQPFHGNYGVYIFFGISGFLITTLLLKEKVKTGAISLRHFYIRRFLRIFPVAYLYIAVLMILNLVLDLKISSDDFLSAALYVQNTSLFNPVSKYFEHFWTLAIEEQFYLIFPVFIKANLKGYLIIVGLFIVFTPVVSYLDITQRVSFPVFHIFNEVIRYMPGLLIGSGASVPMFYGAIVINEKVKFRSVIVLLLLLAGGILISKPNALHFNTLSYTVAYVCVAAMLVLSLTPGTDFMFRLLNNKVFATIGVYSYSLYIWQEIFTAHVPWSGMSLWADSKLLNLLALMVVCYVSYNFYEKPFLMLKDRFR